MTVKIICDKCMREAEVTEIFRAHASAQTPYLAFLHIRCHDIEELVSPSILSDGWASQTLVWSNIEHAFESFQALRDREKLKLDKLTDDINELLLLHRVRRSHAQLNLGSAPLYGDTDKIDLAIDTLLLFRKDPRP